jgi:hypothetical protein
MKGTLENIFVIALAIALLLGIWLIIGMVLKSWFDSYSWYKRIKYTHKFKVPERYKTKVDPIYELTESEWTNSYHIRKWSLKWYEKESHMFLSIMLIYPTEFLTYGYQSDGSVFICEKKDIKEIKGSLEENYERIWNKENEEHLLKNGLKNEQIKFVDELNKVFNENYEKN